MPEIKDILALFVQHRLDLVEGRLVTRRHDVQKTVRGVGGCAPERRVDHARALRGQVGPDLAGRGGDGGAKVDHYLARADARKDAVFAIDEPFHHIRRGEAEHHDIAGLRQVPGRGGSPRVATVDDRLHCVLVEVHHDKLEAALLQVLHHVAAHEAEADEADDRFGHAVFSLGVCLIGSQEIVAPGREHIQQRPRLQAGCPVNDVWLLVERVSGADDMGLVADG